MKGRGTQRVGEPHTGCTRILEWRTATRHTASGQKSTGGTSQRRPQPAIANSASAAAAAQRAQQGPAMRPWQHALGALLNINHRPEMFV